MTHEPSLSDFGSVQDNQVSGSDLLSKFRYLAMPNALALDNAQATAIATLRRSRRDQFLGQVVVEKFSAHALSGVKVHT